MFHAGQKIGPYLLERALGEGSFGVVWLADERTGLIRRQVALKLPRDADVDIEAIRREAETWLRAGKHPHIVQVLHADIYDGQVAIATEYIEGGSLHEWIRRDRGGPVTVEQAVEMTRGILAGLQHLHSLSPKPLVHRDLKPGNVLLSGETPLLTDFGMSRMFSSTAFTQAGGTPAYMPPEAFDDRFSPQTDIWAAGVTLYRMLKSELPFPQRELASLVGAILHKEPEPLPDSVPRAVVNVVMKSMMKDPGRRFQSAAEMRAALDEAMLPRGVVISVPPMPTVGGRSPAPTPTMPAFDIPLVTRADLVVPPVPGHIASDRGSGRDGLAESEALTAIPEPPKPTTTLSERADAVLEYLSRDTIRFCGGLLAALPVWGIAASISRLMDGLRLLHFLPASVLLAGVISVYFARLAWHRYRWQAPQERRRTAMKYAALGLFSGTVVPVAIVAFVIGIKTATSHRSDESPTPPTPPAPREIEPRRPS